MEKIKPIIAYNLLNAEGKELMLQLGVVESSIRSNANLQWRFFGREIPMPVRSGTWFCGFPADTMLKWLNEQGWVLRSKTQIYSGYTRVYEVPSKGNEDVCPANTFNYREAYEGRFEKAIRLIHEREGVVFAVRVYQYAHNCDVYEARRAVTQILALDNQQSVC